MYYQVITLFLERNAVVKLYECYFSVSEREINQSYMSIMSM